MDGGELGPEIGITALVGGSARQRREVKWAHGGIWHHIMTRAANRDALAAVDCFPEANRANRAGARTVGHFMRKC